jgi:phosphoribosylformylglycinamidine cyclo-ligase
LDEGLIEYSPNIIEPTKLYVKQTLKIADYIHGAAHITGGGIKGNLSRIIPEGLGVEIDFNWEMPKIFEDIANTGVKIKDMFDTFNMGIGMIYILSEKNLKKVEEILSDFDEEIMFKSKIIKSDEKVMIKY